MEPQLRSEPVTLVEIFLIDDRERIVFQTDFLIRFVQLSKQYLRQMSGSGLCSHACIHIEYRFSHKLSLPQILIDVLILS